jgi:phosphatidylethanolamine-binding protein (PEBP) family uncharacterized protein
VFFQIVLVPHHLLHDFRVFVVIGRSQPLIVEQLGLGELGFGLPCIPIVLVRKSPILANLGEGSTMRQLPRAFGFAAVLLLTSMHAASAFSASFSWSGIRACGRTSPAFTIQHAPEGTVSLRFVMIDKDAPNFRHGGSAVAYNASGHVREGAIDYIGPCPPAGTTHHYVWTIEALDSSGKVIARTTAEGGFTAR